MKTLLTVALPTLGALVTFSALPASAATRAACLVEANTPELVPDAHTVALLTCDALRARGVDVGQPTEIRGDGPAWRVGLHRLGAQYMVRLSREDTVGEPAAAEQLRLDTLGDIDKAAPRLAEAMTGGRSLTASQEMETVTHAEAHRMEKKDGDFLYGIGVYGMAFLGADAYGSFGFQGAVAYETPEFGAHGALRMGGAGGGGDDSGASFELTVGGRYFFSPTDTAFFAGAGLAGVGLVGVYDDSSYEGVGLGGYGEFGVEFLRLYASRLSIELRVTAPFFELDRFDAFDGWDEEGMRDDAPASIYLMPITLGVGYLW